MKRLCVILLFFPIYFFGQSDTKIIEKDFLDFRKLFDNNQFDEALNYFSDFHFETIDRSELFKYYKMHPVITIPSIIKIIQIDSITAPIKEKEIYFSLVSYSRILKEKKILNNDSVVNVDFENELLIKKKLFGKENIIYNKKTQTLSYIAKYYAYAVWKPNQLHWKFIFVDEENHHLINKIIPNKLILKQISN